MADDRYLSIPLDMGGGGEGGGSGGAGGGSWTVVGLGGGTPEEPDGDPRSSDTKGYVVDRFNDRTVSPPTIVAGSSAGSFAVGGYGSQRRWFNTLPWVLYPDHDDVTPHEEPFTFISGRVSKPGSGYGQNVPHTATPSWAEPAVGLDYTNCGYAEAEMWWKLTIGAHPASAAGIAVAVGRGGGKGYGAVGSMQVVVAYAQPTSLREGIVVGEVGPSASATITIPIGLIPAEGDELWVGYRTGWETAFKTDVYRYAFIWPSHAGPQSYQLDSAGTPYGGYSGSITLTVAPSSATWQTFSSGADDLGSTADPGDAPFGGPHVWTKVEEQGSPSYGIDADGLYAESTASAVVGVALRGPGEDEDADDGVWSMYEGCRIDVLWSMDAEGLTGQAGTRSLEVAIEAEGQSCIAKVHLGDGAYAEGVSADGGAGIAYKAKDLEADTRYVLAVDTRSTILRVKVWTDDGPLSEPGLWDVEVPIASSLSEADRFTLRLRVGNVVSSQRVTVHRVTAYAAARQGDTVAWEMVGLADGSSRTYPTAHQYEPGSLVASASGIIVKPQTEWPQLAMFATDFPPTTDAILRCRYVVAGPEADE